MPIAMQDIGRCTDSSHWQGASKELNIKWEGKKLLNPKVI
jgi:hypothetical protein